MAHKHHNPRLLNQKSLEKSIEFEKNHHIYILNQAGILAKDLKEGEPCPVCGSTNHPKKAQIEKNIDERIIVEDGSLEIVDSYKIVSISVGLAYSIYLNHFNLISLISLLNL